MQFLTDFADQAMILPLLAIACCTLAAAGWRRGAWAVAGASAATLAAVLLGKAVFVACPPTLLESWRLHSPSGHTASAALAFGGLSALSAPSRGRGWIAVAVAAVAAVLFGFSRLSLGVHTLADVLAGSAIGVAGAGGMALTAGPHPVRFSSKPLLLAGTLIAALLFHGWHLPAESRIDAMAHQLWPFSLCRK